MNFGSIDVGLTTSSSVGAATTNKLYLYDQTNLDVPPESVIDGYRIGAKNGETLSVIINNNSNSQIVSSEIVMQVPQSLVGIVNISSTKVYEVALDGNNQPDIEDNIITFLTPHALQTGEKVRVLSTVAFLPNGIEANEVYFAITSPQDPTLTSTQIKLAKSLNDAIRDTEIDINNVGQFLRVESRVSDKRSGEIGHPIQWDSSALNWYITANTANNAIYDSIKL